MHANDKSNHVEAWILWNIRFHFEFVAFKFSNKNRMLSISRFETILWDIFKGPMRIYIKNVLLINMFISCKFNGIVKKNLQISDKK